MTLQQLRYFLAACQHGSFTAAADSLFIAQPSLAEQVRRLEQELGVRLFVRTGRKLTLTEAGSNLETTRVRSAWRRRGCSWRPSATTTSWPRWLSARRDSGSATALT